MSHRDVLLEMLELEQREIAIRDYAIANLTEDKNAQFAEGFKRRAETTEQAITRNQHRRTDALLKAAALAAAINKLGEAMPNVTIPIKRVHTDAIIPKQAKASDAGYDLHALENYDLDPHERERVRTGISIGIPEG